MLSRSLHSPPPSDFVPLKPAVLEILLALAEAPLHGYGILARIREAPDSGVHLETGPLYRHLKRLLDDGLVLETEAPADEAESDERRRYYALSPLGREVLSLEGRRLSEVVARGRALGFISG